jgi:hypothetical protein
LFVFVAQDGAAMRFTSSRTSLSFLLLPFWSMGHPCNALFHFSFLKLRQSVGLLGRGIGQSQGLYLHKTTQTQKKHTQTSMPSAAFAPTIPVFERAKTVHASDRAATVIGHRPLFMTDFDQKLY